MTLGGHPTCGCRSVYLPSGGRISLTAADEHVAVNKYVHVQGPLELQILSISH